jgi:hypothetical protein
MKLKKSLLLIFLVVFTISSLFATILKVDINGGQEYASIQSAVNAATNGDTVLVYLGTYFENVDFGNKGLTLASLHLTTGDPTYIDQTIIDGGNNDRCIYINGVSHSCQINGLTITNGKGGLYIRDVPDSVIVEKCNIKDNSSNQSGGGGMYVRNISLFILRNSTITRNFAITAGGLYIRNSFCKMEGTSIFNNRAYQRGGGISLIWEASIEFDTINLCNLYMNYASMGSDFQKSSSCPPAHIVVDTFTVMNPQKYHATSINDWGYPKYDITYDIQNAKLEQYNSDLYVSPEGNDQNTGLSPDEALMTLTRAQLKIVSDSMHPNTIYLDSGLYSPSSNGEFFPMALRSYITIDGSGKDITIIGADSLSHIFNAWAMTKDFAIKNLTLGNGFDPDGIGLINVYESINSTIENVKLYNGGGSFGSGVFQTRSITLDNVEVSNSFGGFQAIGFGISYSAYHQQTTDTIKLINSHIHHSKPAVIDGFNFPGGGIDIFGNYYHDHNMTAYILNCLVDSLQMPNTLDCGLAAIDNPDVYIVNSTFGNNILYNSTYGAAVSMMSYSNIYVYNSIFFNNLPMQFSQQDYNGEPTRLEIYNSLVEGGEDDIYVASPEHILHYDPTNIDTDPLWANDGWYPYMLMPGSPCINTGTLDLPSHIQLPETDLAGNPRIYDGQIDMGAYEFGPWVGLDYQKPKAKSQKLTASPNPFRDHCQIKYECKEQGQQSIFVYDLQGMRVVTLMDITGQPASGQINWNGTDDYGRKLKPGIYIIELTNNKRSLGSVKVEVF